MIERIAIAVLTTIMLILLLPVAALYRIYDWLEDRRFEREVIAKYQGDGKC